jgi:hypothetical protein
LASCEVCHPVTHLSLLWGVRRGRSTN